MFKTISEKFIEFFENKKEELIYILTEGENYKTAIEEYRRSLRTLENSRLEEIAIDQPLLDHLSVYLPYNNVLYSYVLYGVIPSLVSKKIYIRPAHLSADVAIKIHGILGSFFEDQIFLQRWTRKEFIEFVKKSNAVAFTGKYVNLPEIVDVLRTDQLLIYGGDGLVSFIVAKDSVLDAAVDGAIFDRLYASGQDCICPDIFLVHESVLADFVNILKTKLSKMQFGTHRDINADYSRNLKYEVVESVDRFLVDKKQNVVFGAPVDLNNMIVHPTIVLDDSNLMEYSFFEFYSPVFRIFSFSTNEQLLSFYKLPFQEDIKMGASVFGDYGLAEELRKLNIVVAHNLTFFQQENGNKPFGGFGVRASHILKNGKTYPRPILLSKELTDFQNSTIDKTD